MHERSVRLSGKRMYIAHLAARMQSMESGRTAMHDYPAALLAAQLGRSCPPVLHALEQCRFEAVGSLPGPQARQAHSVACALLRKLSLKTA